MRFSIPDFISEDFPRKLIALIFAVMVYVYVKQELHEPHTFQNIPVEIDIASPFVVEEHALGKLKVTVRGSETALQRLTSADIEVLVKVSDDDLKAGLLELPVTSDDVTVPFGITVVEISPSYISIDVDKEIEKEVDVRVMTFGNLPSHLKETRRRVSPRRLTITGPSRLLEGINELVTKEVLLDELENSHRIKKAQEVRLTAEVDRSNLSPLVRLSKLSVKAFFYIEPAIGEATLVNMAIRVMGQPAEGLELASKLPLIRNVGLEGPRAMTEKVDPLKPPAGIYPFIDLTGLKEEGEHMVKVHAWTPADSIFTAVYNSPPSIKIVLRRKAVPVTPKSPDKVDPSK